MLRDLRKFIFENYYRQIALTEKYSYYSFTKSKKRVLVLFATNLTKKKYVTPEENYELFAKTSKTLKTQKVSDIKSALKPIKQLNIITEELETVGKPNIF